MVGVLYSQLAALKHKNPAFEKYWRRVITFSTQGIDSLGLRDEKATQPLAEKNICSIEYKFEFNNSGPFNHALAVVDFIVAWSVTLSENREFRPFHASRNLGPMICRKTLGLVQVTNVTVSSVKPDVVVDVRLIGQRSNCEMLEVALRFKMINYNESNRRCQLRISQ